MRDYNGFSSAQRSRAGAWLKREQDAGRIPLPEVCCACGQDQGVLDSHAEDYSEPFGPHIHRYPLCYRCHMMVHCRYRAPEQWRRYLTCIRIGMRFVPLYSRAFHAITSQLSGTTTPYVLCGRRLTTPLDGLKLDGDAGSEP